MIFRSKHIILFYLSAILVFLSSCENSVQEVAAVSNLKKQPAVTAKKIEVLYSDSGLIKLLLKAPEVIRMADEKEPYIEYPQGIDVTFYKKNHEIESTLTAKHAIYYENKQFWVASNNVVAYNKERNETMNTEELNWDVQKEHFYSDKFVKITSPEKVLCGEGFEATQNFNNWKIKRIKNSFINLDE